MRCAHCHAAAPENSKFCSQCGQALSRPCQNCRHVNPTDAKFCSNCGTDLGTSPSSNLQKATVRSGVDHLPAEMRQITVLFCDMVGSTALSTTLDPEDHRELVSSFQGGCAAAIQRLDGMVAQYLGDGVLAYFGYPKAHEDDAERAIRAGLAIIAESRALRSTEGVTIEARIGVAG